MRLDAWARRLRPIPSLVVIAAGLAGCVCCGPRHYGDDGRKPGFSYTPASQYELLRAQAPRRQ